MMKAAMTSDDGKRVVVCGLSFKNLQGLKDLGPILVHLSEFGHRGKVIFSFTPDGTVAAPKDPESHHFAFTEDTLDALRGGHMIVINMDKPYFTGDIVVFAAEDERTMEEQFKEHFSIDNVRGSTCPKCRTGRREDGSCDCPETMQ